MRTWLDHFVVAIDDLDRGIDDFEARTGVRAAFGGEHPTLGTHNALVSLGPSRYFEILAPRPGAELHPLFGRAAEHSTLTPILWAAATDDLDAVHARLRDAGFDVADPVMGAREAGGGDTLRWRMVLPGEAVPAHSPFFTEWHADTRHPSETSPAGCSLASFVVSSPDAPELGRLVDSVGLDTTVSAEGSGLTITLDTPRGTVVIDGRA